MCNTVMLDYRVLQHDFLGDLEAKVREAGEQGWRPQGGICVAYTAVEGTQFPNHYRFRLVYLQAMVREKCQAGDEKRATGNERQETR